MKTILKYVVGLIYLPVLALAGIIAIIKLVYNLIFVFAWQTAEEWEKEMLLWIDNKINSLKS